MSNACALCGLARPLENSHIFPAFIFRWLKKTSGGMLFRRPVTPNILYQDGEQRPLLCAACEDLFQADEDLFSKRIFWAIVNSTTTGPLEYDLFLARFLISILWRHLVLTLTEPNPPLGNCGEHFIAAEKEWRAFLLNEGPLTQYGRLHLFVTDPISNTEFNVYLARAVDATIVTSESGGHCAVYAKFARFIVWAELSATFNATEWVNTRINIGPGVLQPGTQRVVDRGFGNFLIDRARTAKQLLRNASPTQVRKTLERTQRNIASIADSELGRVIAADAMARSRVPRAGRNQPCPCGSGLKYKKCHGLP